MKIKFAPPEACIVTAPMSIPEPPKPVLQTEEETAALARFIEQINAPVGPTIRTPEEHAAVAKFVEQLNRAPKPPR